MTLKSGISICHSMRYRRTKLLRLWIYKKYCRLLCPVVCVSLLSACSSARQFMATPNLYFADASYSAEAEVPAESAKSPELKIVYATDRLNESDDPASAEYLNGRSATIEFGEATIALEPEVDWQALSDASDGKRGLKSCLLYTSPSPRDGLLSRMPSSA